MSRNIDTPKNNDSIMEELLDKVNKMEKEIADLKMQLSNNQQHYYPPISVIPTNQCDDGGDHQYPNPWHSVLPPHCMKCGKQASGNPITFNGDLSTGEPPWDFNIHGGNVMNSDFIVTHDSNQEIKTNYIINNICGE